MFVLLRKQWALIFNNDAAVVEIVAHIIPLVGLLQLLDGISTVGSGVLRACGQQVGDRPVPGSRVDLHTQGIAAVMVIMYACSSAS